MLFLCVTPGNSTTASCSEADICLQPNQAEDDPVFTEVSTHANGFAEHGHRKPIHTHILVIFVIFSYHDMFLYDYRCYALPSHTFCLAHCGLAKPHRHLFRFYQVGCTTCDLCVNAQLDEHTSLCAKQTDSKQARY